jgi:hypothetical protein
MFSITLSQVSALLEAKPRFAYFWNTFVARGITTKCKNQNNFFILLFFLMIPDGYVEGTYQISREFFCEKNPMQGNFKKNRFACTWPYEWSFFKMSHEILHNYL